MITPNLPAQHSVQWTLGILARFQAFSYASAVSVWTASPSPAPAAGNAHRWAAELTCRVKYCDQAELFHLHDQQRGQLMHLSLLDNPIWHALNSYHDHMSIRGEGTVRYPPDILGAAAMPENSRVGFANLRGSVETDESVVVLGPLSEDLTGWEVVHMDQAWQLIPEDLKPAPQVDAAALTAKNVPEMLDLVNLAQPGPFLPRAIELGQFLGLRQDGRLVAMAGQRLHLPGFCEVSTVCTHPEYRGRGYAGALTTMMAQSLLERQETAFLHVAPGNDRALRLYLKLGFRVRTQIQLSILKKLAH